MMPFYFCIAFIKLTEADCTADVGLQKSAHACVYLYIYIYIYMVEVLKLYLLPAYGIIMYCCGYCVKGIIHMLHYF